MAGFLDSEAVQIGQLLGNDFKSLYKIPLLQRKYVWGEDEITSLLEDIKDSFDNSEPYYFVGGMVFANENKSDRLIVIDGQQRIITIMLLLAAAIRRFKREGKVDLLSFYEQRVRLQSLDPHTGNTATTYSLELQGSDHEVFRNLLSGQKLSKNGMTVSERNLIEASEVIREFVDGFGLQELQKYMAHLLHKVYVVQTVAENQSTAFTIFETLNDRGAKLQPEDLLKNFLLQHMNDSDFDQFASQWQKFIEKLMKPNGRYIVALSTFLRHYIMSYGTYTTRTKIFDWFQNQNIDHRDKAYERLLDLDRSAHSYSEFMEGKEKSYLSAMKQLRFRQGYIVLLACINLSRADQDRIGAVLEKIAFAYVITGAKTNRLERRFCKIAQTARSAEEDPGQVSDLLEQLYYILMEMEEPVEAALSQLSCITRSDKRKVLYLLSQLAHSLDGADYSNYTLEHIMPQNTNHLDAEAYEKQVLAIGNLTLLSKQDNSAAKDKPFDEKIGIYLHQSCRLTSSLVRQISTGTKKTKFDQAVTEFNYEPPNPPVWNKKEIDRRTQALIRLAKHVWFTHA